ncbi:MAG: hydantoinase/oxoprolinase family protein [Nitrososphaerota archaeon]|nr:hydantoinase/oxoprolinase family protein [Nitrososphaerota archaeon]MDG7024144.1 hydantoinase/oxoprolinase family protein [Nitrososphaerota archaeon]
MPVRVAIDVGGTFTDLCGLNEATGEYTFVKDSTTPDNYATGVINVVRRSGIKGEEMNRFIGTGSTMVINALTEMKGAKTVLVTTKGFRDVLELQRSNRTDIYNLRYQKPKPFVPRRFRFEVDERTSYNGEEVRPLNRGDVEKAADACNQSGAEAVAIAFYNAYANPKHELECYDILRSRVKTPYITMSHDLSREWREYERMNTAVMNAFVQPKVHRYLTTLETELRKIGTKVGAHVMQSNGGVSTFEQGRKTPIYQVESGPIGGVIGAEVIGKTVGTANVITFDVGGTTAKTSLIDSGKMKINTEYFIGRSQFFSGYPVKVPVVDIVEIGAGGGSIAWVDELGSLKAGPQSAGADPGPACEGKGGTEPTLTDAFVLTGVIDPNYFLGGEIKLKPELSERAFGKVGAKLHMKAIDAAIGTIEIATANMVNAIKLVSVRRGYDPRDFAMVAFGGGGPMFATSLAEELGIRKVIVPRVPGVFSAWGMLMTDLRHDYIRTKVVSLEPDNLKELQSILDEMKEEATKQLGSEGIGGKDMRFEGFFDIRYRGQEHTISTPVPMVMTRDSLALIHKRFQELHYRAYTFNLKDPTEVVNIRMVAFGRVKKHPPKPMKASRGRAKPAKTRSVYLDESGFRRLPVYSRDSIPVGAKIHGPAIIEEPTSTTILRRGNLMTNDRYGNLVVEV